MVVFGSAGFDDVHDAFIIAVKENALARRLRPPDMAGDKNGVRTVLYRPFPEVVERATTRQR